MNANRIETNIRDLEGILKWRPDLADDVRNAIAESVRLLAENRSLTAQLAKSREATVEECAKVAESDWVEPRNQDVARHIARKLRALTTGERQ